MKAVDVLRDPLLNRGTAFAVEEREARGLTGLIPPRVESIEEQVARVLANLRGKSSALEKYIYLSGIQNDNETLYFRTLIDNLEETLPLVYTPTVGEACLQWSRIYQRPRGLYLSVRERGRIAAALRAWPQRNVAIIVVTDGGRILGLGDLGANGMGIPIGKLGLYVACAGVNPAQCLPVMLDVGTDTDAVRDDPFYLGTRAPRLARPEYDALVEEFVAAAQESFPGVLVQFEDFGNANAFRLLERYRNRVCSFNDDIQGTGAVTLAAVLAGIRLTGQRFGDLRVLIAGAGSAGIGIGRALRGARIWMCDVDGLLTVGRPGLMPAQREFAVDEAPATLAEAARRVRPHVLVGVTGQRGAFTRGILEAMDGPRPLVFPLSNPTSCAECTPEEARAATLGRAIVATGSPFEGTSQCNNVYIFPGVGLGVLSCDATRVTDGMIRAAAEALAAMAPIGEGDRLFPPMTEIRRVSREVAFAVASRAMTDGVAAPQDEDVLRARIDDEVWEPEYVPYRRPEDAP